MSQILTVNAGSSSIKLALYETHDTLQRSFEAVIQGIGQPPSRFTIKHEAVPDHTERTVTAPDHAAATGILIDWLKQQIPAASVSAIGHRIVHGGPKYHEPQVINDEVMDNLSRLEFFDPEHVPAEIQLVKAFQAFCPQAVQVACFDTAFHHDLPSAARLLPIPRRYEAQGIRRYGFHGLSYTFVLEELSRVAGADAANSRLVLAHLGSGVSLAAVHKGKPVDTTMSLTPASGLPMSTRSGDIDPGLALYLAKSGGMDASRYSDLVNFQSGLLGISGTTSDMKELLGREAGDSRAKEAVDLFCYQVKKSIGSLSAALGGLDVLVFTGGMGEDSPAIRSRICKGLEFLGIGIEESRNTASDSLISSGTSRVAVRVIHTDESSVIARDTWKLINSVKR